jgi:hypothetical protein
MWFKRLATLGFIVFSGACFAAGECDPEKDSGCATPTQSDTVQVLELLEITAPNTGAGGDGGWWFQRVRYAVDNYQLTCVPAAGKDASYTSENIRNCVAGATNAVGNAAYLAVVRYVVNRWGQVFLTEQCSVKVLGELDNATPC